MNYCRPLHYEMQRRLIIAVPIRCYLSALISGRKPLAILEDPGKKSAAIALSARARTIGQPQRLSLAAINSA
ncbi:protein of unknown function [Methylocella tundrae]|uniref:Uncharacterized protein n=1 Tax=Methylocella tundrae TaxID=227605 RepID=A0A4U8Z2L6_METTU|nr:protein of unknown function [Methylocella tundrae]